jgi:hypothetical protein
MKASLQLLVVIIALSFIGCATTHHKLKLTPEEIAILKSKQNVPLSNSLRKRLINDSNELKLTKEEKEVLRRTGKVILCGKCGHLLGTKSYSKWAKEHETSYKPTDKFVPNSLRTRILQLTTD